MATCPDCRNERGQTDRPASSATGSMSATTSAKRVAKKLAAPLSGAASRVVMKPLLQRTTKVSGKASDFNIGNHRRSTVVAVRRLLALIVVVLAALSVTQARAGDQRLVVGYVSAWGSDGPDRIAALKGDLIDVLNVDGAPIARSGECKLAKPKAWQRDGGVLDALRLFRGTYPFARMTIVIDSTGDEPHLPRAASTEAGRRKLVRSCLDLFVRDGLFDGVDLDWEFPRGTTARQNFTLLAREFRLQLDALRPDLLLTAALPGDPTVRQRFDLGAITPTLDWVNLMGYDLHGSWDRRTNFHGPLRHSPLVPDDGITIDTTVTELLNAGIAPQRIMLGVPFYGRAYRGVSARGGGIAQSIAGPSHARGVHAGGAISYANIVAFHQAGYQVHLDERAAQAWRYNPNTRTFMVSETPATIALKMAYARERNLGGAMIWELSQDDPEGSLLGAIRSGLGRDPVGR